MNYIQSTSDCHIQGMKCLLEHLLYVFSVVIDHKLLDPSDGTEKIADLFILWVQNCGVIGEQCFGGPDVKKFKEELEVSTNFCDHKFTCFDATCVNIFCLLL